MNKLRLNTDTLRVESFPAIAEAPLVGGTVKGHEGFTAYGNETCRPFYTCPECATPPV